jgi:hypothetical protein
VYDKEGENMAGVRNKERRASQDVEERHAPVLRCMHGMALGFDEDAGARKYGALLAEMYRYPIADESNGVFLLIYAYQGVSQM